MTHLETCLCLINRAWFRLQIIAVVSIQNSKKLKVRSIQTPDMTIKNGQAIKVLLKWNKKRKKMEMPRI